MEKSERTSDLRWKVSWSNSYRCVFKTYTKLTLSKLFKCERKLGIVTTDAKIKKSI